MAAAVDPTNIIAEAAVNVSVDALQPYGKNPRKGDVAAIAESLAANGQFRAIIVQRSTGQILAGNHTFKAAKSLGWKEVSVAYVDVDDEKAKAIVLADNRTNDFATYDSAILADILSGMPSLEGTGYKEADVSELLAGITEANVEQVQNVMRPPPAPFLTEDGEITREQDNSIGGPRPMERPDFEDGVTGSNLSEPEEDDGGEGFRDELGELQGILQLKENMVFLSSNYYGIPDLATGGLLQSLPSPLDTWGGQDATPDDGVTTWVWNYGVAARKGLPMDRAILCFYTYDEHFESFWSNPAYMTAKVINAGITMAVVPDFSFYDSLSVAEWVYNTFRAQWLGRYFQEAGIKVIPRVQFGIDKKDSASLDFNTAGIPKNAPILAKSAQNSASKEQFDLEVYGMQKSMEKVTPETLLMYGGNPAKRVLEALDPIGKGLCQNVVHIQNYAAKRRGVVFDRKEGLADPAYKAAMRKQAAKDKARMKRDSTTEDAAPAPEDDGDDL